jgi:hypothetical protein
VTEGNRNKQWALRSIRTEAHVGPKGPNAFASALAGGFDEGERAVYVSVMLRYPYGPYMTATTARLGATNFPAAGDAERLRRLADNYQLRQYPTEPDESFEERLGLAWELHEEGGTAIAERKAFEAYGFAEIYILEECDYIITGYECEYQWAWEVVFGPNYGTVPIDGCYLGTAILGDEATGYLGLGSFSSEQLDDLVRIALDHRQAQDMPIRFIFRFGAAALLGLAELGVAVLGGGANNVAIREIQGRRMVGSCYLGTTTLKGFGVTHNG